MTATEPISATDTWTAEIEQLRTRYKHASPAILAALNILVKQNDISIEDAKAKAELHGARITTASMKAAHVLLSRMDTLEAATAAAAKLAREPRRVRATEKPADAESLVRAFVAKLQGQGNAEAERLREAMRKAIAVLHAALA